MTAPVLAGKLRTAKSSDDYVAEYMKRSSADGQLQKISTAEKKAKLAQLLSDEVKGFRRIGVGMIGPIQLKLRYQGLVRNVLIEDPITPGATTEYEIMDDLGQAYLLSGHDGEVRVTPFEGKRARVEFFRIASFPAVRKEDLYSLRVNAVEYAQDESKQAILKQEDSRLMILLQAALTDYATRPDNPFPGAQTVTIANNGPISPAALYTAVTMTDVREIESARLLVHPAEYRDFYMFGQDDTGWALKDRIVAGEKITTFGEFQIHRSIIVPKGTVFLLPEPDFLGVFPVEYSLDVEENNRVESFWKGWVMDEMISMAILNPRGIASITKIGTHPAGSMLSKPFFQTYTGTAGSETLTPPAPSGIWE